MSLLSNEFYLTIETIESLSKALIFRPILKLFIRFTIILRSMLLVLIEFCFTNCLLAKSFKNIFLIDIAMQLESRLLAVISNGFIQCLLHSSFKNIN